MERVLAGIAQRLGTGLPFVNVGFLAGRTYPKEAKKLLKSKKIDARVRSQAEKIAGGPSLNVAQVAFWNEFGTKRAPPRPFFRRMIEKEKPGWGLLMAAAVKQANYDSRAALDVAGERVSGQLVQSIRDLTSPPLAEYTIRKKGFDKPLIDTSIMINSVDHVVKAS